MRRDERELQAYYDGELRGLSRWLFTRRLARSPELQSRLAELERLGGWLRGEETAVAGLDLWPAIAMRLPALDAQRAEAGALAPQVDFRVESGSGFGWLRPAAAALATAALALAVVLGIIGDGAPTAPGVISWLDTGGRNVLIIDWAEDSTIIWLLDTPTEGASRGGLSGAV
jgi:anti-sigma factor RsiW